LVPLSGTLPLSRFSRESVWTQAHSLFLPRNGSRHRRLTCGCACQSQCRPDLLPQTASTGTAGAHDDRRLVVETSRRAKNATNGEWTLLLAASALIVSGD
ncbi:MAG: hypothetical protein ACXVCX_09435, partial [Ktedonobacterales bacterium]